MSDAFQMRIHDFMKVQDQGAISLLDDKSFKTIFLLKINMSWSEMQHLHALFEKTKQQTSKKFYASGRSLRINLRYLSSLICYYE